EQSAGAAESWSDDQTQTAVGQHTPSLPPSTTPSLHHPAASPERVVRLTAENLNRLLGLAGESLVESRWLRPFADSLQRLKRQHSDLSQKLNHLRLVFQEENLSGRTEVPLNELFRSVSECQQFLSQRMEE